MSLKRSRCITILLKATHLLSGTLRILLQDNGQVKIHHAVDEEQVCSTRQATVRLDKGYTEAYTDSEEEWYGQGPLETSSPRRATTARSRSGTGPASMARCAAIRWWPLGRDGIGCEETTTHSSIAWTWI